MKFAREGTPFIAAGLLVSAAAWVTSWALQRAGGGWVWPTAAAVVSVLALFVVWFFRDPDHPLPVDPRHVVAPGQGRVIVVDEADEPTFMEGRCRKISIFLSVFDVHVQRAPVSGTVAHRAYRPGTYAVAWADKASEDNEQASLGFVTAHGKVLVRQIAGLVARRIVTYPHEGDTVACCDRIGIIRFGSRVDLFLPLDWRVTCAVGDRAVAGLTVLAHQPATVREPPESAVGNPITGTGEDARERAP